MSNRVKEKDIESFSPLPADKSKEVERGGGRR
jgi:hypothetical protein